VLQVDTATTSSACAFLTLRREPFLHVFGGETALRAETETTIRDLLGPKLDRLFEGQAAPAGAREAQPQPA
jgi:hypothetical protein